MQLKESILLIKGGNSGTSSTAKIRRKYKISFLVISYYVVIAAAFKLNRSSPKLFLIIFVR